MKPQKGKETTIRDGKSKIAKIHVGKKVISKKEHLKTNSPPWKRRCGGSGGGRKSS